MKRIVYLLTIFALGMFLVHCSLDEGLSSDGDKQESEYTLVINEFLASNDACNADEYGEYDDWLELYNYGTDTVNIAGLYFSDDKSDITAYQIPDTDPEKTKIPPGGFLLLWADGQPEQGVLHLDFKLSSSGEDIVITEPDGYTIIDEHTFEPQETDISKGRYPDGGDEWRYFSKPTPGASNVLSSESMPPQIGNIAVSPEEISAGDTVTVSATVTDEDGDLQKVELFYGGQDTLDNVVEMTGSDDTYSAEIGPFEDGTKVYFLIVATDSKGNSSSSDTLSFEVGYVAPVLYINEFLASNDSCCADEHGDYDDWIEIYNPGPDSVDIGGMYITDDLNDLTAWQIPTTAPELTVTPPHGYLVLWADKEPEEGVLHVGIKLSSDGEQIGLIAPNGTTIIDSLTFGPQTTDVSYGRYPDGSDNWQTFATPTPGEPNSR